MPKFIPKIGEKYWIIIADGHYEDEPYLRYMIRHNEGFLYGREHDDDFEWNCFKKKYDAIEKLEIIKSILRNA